MKRLIVAMGLPGSGKTTAVERWSQERGIPLISIDAIRKRLTGSESDQSKNGEAWDFAMKRVAVLQAAHDVIVFDATFARPEERRKFLEDMRTCGIDTITGLYFTAPFSVAQERNLLRDRVVPEHAMVRMHEQFTIDGPVKEDGFDALLKIRADEDVDVVYREVARELSGTMNTELSKLR